MYLEVVSGNTLQIYAKCATFLLFLQIFSARLRLVNFEHDQFGYVKSFFSSISLQVLMHFIKKFLTLTKFCWNFFCDF